MIKKRKKAFTLVEILIAMVIIAIISATFYKVYYIAIKSSEMSKAKVEGMLMAQNYIEQVKAAGNIELAVPTSDRFTLNVQKNVEEQYGSSKLINFTVTVVWRDYPDTNLIEFGTKIYIK